MPLDQDSKCLLTERARVGLKALEKLAIASRPERTQVEKRYQAARARRNPSRGHGTYSPG